METWKKYGWILILPLLFFACEKDVVIEPVYQLNLPPGFPQPEIPEDNQLTAERVALGKKLFFDPILSKDQTLSCASCHFPEQAFSDTLALSNGIEGRHSFRNSPTLANVAYHPYMFKDGGVHDLEHQVFVPLLDSNEMGAEIEDVIASLNNHPEYPQLFDEAYDRQPDVYALIRALASFERILISGNSAYDKYEFQGDEGALNESEKRGMDLFFSSQTNCSGCHSGFNFTNYAFENNGIYQHYPDSGRARVTTLHSDVGKFKVPTLRNVELTAPYMHDGSIQTLEEVIGHYDSGGKGHFNQSNLVQPLALSEQEKTDLVNFLKALTDEDFVDNPKYRP